MTDELTPLVRALARLMAAALVNEFRAELSKVIPPPAALVPPAPVTNRMLRLPEVCQRVGLRRASVYRLMELDKFPHAIKISDRAVAWSEADIAEWVAERQAKR